MFTRWSNQKIQFWTLLAILGSILIALLLNVLKTSLTCVDEEGCLLQHCTFYSFTEQYKTILDISISKNSNCCYGPGSRRNTCIGFSNDPFYDEADTCQPDVNAYLKARVQIEAQATQNLESSVNAALAYLVTNNVPDSNGADADLSSAKAYVLLQNYEDLNPTATPSDLQPEAVVISDACKSSDQVADAKTYMDEAVLEVNQSINAVNYM